MVGMHESGQTLVLENLRFHPEEEKNDPTFAEQLARLDQVAEGGLVHEVVLDAVDLAGPRLTGGHRHRQPDLAVVATDRCDHAALADPGRPGQDRQPRLVRPTRPGDPVRTPLDNTLPANDADLFLMGKNEITPAEARLAVGHQRPFVGHMLDLRREGANVVQVKN